MDNIQEINRRVIEQFRAGGEVEGMHREGLLLLTTTGARTGQRRTTPMMFHRDGDRVVVMASNAGASREPDWYRNLVADGQVMVEVGDERYDAVATTLRGEERERVWRDVTSLFPFFTDHAAKAGREIPLVGLARA